MLETSRRSLITGLGACLFAAPAIVRVASIMPVKVVEPQYFRLFYRGQPVYGRSPAMDILPDLIDINKAIAEYARLMGIPQHWLKDHPDAPQT